MDISINFNIDNEAFKHDPSHEIVRILCRLIDKLTSTACTDDFIPLSDINGNKVGSFNITGKC